MALQPLAWSEPRSTGLATIQAEDGDRGEWTVTPVPRDVVRVSYFGNGPNGSVISGTDLAYAESLEEALILVDVLRAGTDHLPGWREQLEAAGLVRTYPERTDGLAGLWNDVRKSGMFQIDVRDGSIERSGVWDVCVHATYESGSANFWHNVSSVTGPWTKGDHKGRDCLPHGVDPLKAGVAAALAIRAARIARRGSFAKPLGGPTKKR